MRDFYHLSALNDEAGKTQFPRSSRQKQIPSSDPTLSAEVFPSWLEALKKQELDEIKGKIVVDPSRFEPLQVPGSWPWGDVGNYYGAGVSGLNFNGNAYELVFQPGALGKPAPLIKTNPTPPGVVFENYMLTGPAGSNPLSPPCMTPNPGFHDPSAKSKFLAAFTSAILCSSRIYPVWHD